MGEGLASAVYRATPGDTDGIRFSGAVLAGGRSRRMGFPKSRLIVAGETLLHRQLRLLALAGASELLISLNSETQELPPEDLCVRTVLDRLADTGPLAGIESLLQASQKPWVTILAVDLPRLNLRFIGELLHRVTPTSGVVPVHGGRLEPLCAVYPKSATAIATRLLGEGRREASGLAATGVREGWLQPWTIDGPAVETLTNWNHPWDVRETGAATSDDSRTSQTTA
ncbi:MAG: molybdenum cofactor guanylyltransferase [Verrucomicrobiota bacterium]